MHVERLKVKIANLPQASASRCSGATCSQLANFQTFYPAMANFVVSTSSPTSLPAAPPPATLRARTSQSSLPLSARTSTLPSGTGVEFEQ